MATRFLMMALTVVFAAGCGVKAQTYVMTKERVDIDSTGGNGGYLGGSGTYNEPVKKTRKVYALELSKPVPESEVKKIEQTISTTTVEKTDSTSAYESVAVERAPATSVGLHIPVIEDEPVVAATGPREATTYTVLKDETLQKISKKVYGSYGKWYKIYEANKDKLKNPNFVKPGTVLTIPAAE